MSEFFIPYKALQPGQRRFLHLVVAALLALIIALGFSVPSQQNQYGAGRRQPVKELSGWLIDGPGGAQLLVPRPGNTPQDEHYSRILLAGPGKTAPPDSVMDHTGSWVSLKGQLFSHGPLSVMNTRMATPLDPPAEANSPNLTGVPQGRFRLDGEIVDGKCFSGVMKPGAGKTHMGCAIRCISGGVPALFHVTNSKQEVMDLVLIDEQNRTVNDRILPLVAQPIRIEGDVLRFDNLLALRADPETYEPLKGTI